MSAVVERVVSHDAPASLVGAWAACGACDWDGPYFNGATAADTAHASARDHNRREHAAAGE